MEVRQTGVVSNQLHESAFDRAVLNGGCCRIAEIVELHRAFHGGRSQFAIGVVGLPTLLRSASSIRRVAVESHRFAQ